MLKPDPLGVYICFTMAQVIINLMDMYSDMDLMNSPNSAYAGLQSMVESAPQSYF